MTRPIRMIVVLGAICILGIIASPLIVQVTNFGFHSVAGKFDLSHHESRIGAGEYIDFPEVLFMPYMVALLLNQGFGAEMIE